MRRICVLISSLGLMVLLSASSVRLFSAPRASWDTWGEQWLARKDYEKAARCFSFAVKAQPRDAQAYRGLGYAQLQLHDEAGGLRSLEYALRLNPYDRGLRAYLSGLYQDYGDRWYRASQPGRALAWWGKALALQPGNRRLAAYAAWVRGRTAPVQTAAPAALAAAPPRENAAAPARGASSISAPGINPWILGSTVAALGAVMLFLF